MAQDIPIRISIDGRDAQRGADQATDSLRNFQERSRQTDDQVNRLDGRLGGLSRSFESLRSRVVSLQGVLGALGGALAVQQMVRFGEQALSTAESLSDVSQRTGISIELLQGLRQAFDQTGGSSQRMDQALSRFNRRIGLAIQNTGAANKVIDRLDIELETTSGRIRDTGAVLDDVIQQIASMESQSRQAAVASRFFGEEVGPALVPLLSQGTEAIDRFTESLKESGAFMSEDMVRSGAEASAVLRRVRSNITTAFQAGILESFADETGGIESALERLVPVARDAGEVVGNFLEFGSENAGEFLDQLEDVAQTIAVIQGASTGGRLFGIPGAIGGGAAAFVGTEILFNEAQTQIERASELREQISRLIEKQNELEGSSESLSRSQKAQLEGIRSSIDARRDELQQLLQTSDAMRKLVGGQQEASDSQEGLASSIDVTTNFLESFNVAQEEAGNQIDVTTNFLESFIALNEQSDQQLASSIEQINAQTEALERQADAAATSREELEKTQRALEAERVVRESGLEVTEENIARVREALRARAEAREELEKNKAALEDNEESTDGLTQAQSRNAAQVSALSRIYRTDTEIMLESTRAFVRGSQNELADFFDDFLEGEIDSVSDLWDGMLDTMQRSLAEFAASVANQQIIVPMATQFLGGTPGGGASGASSLQGAGQLGAAVPGGISNLAGATGGGTGQLGAGVQGGLGPISGFTGSGSGLGLSSVASGAGIAGGGFLTGDIVGDLTGLSGVEGAAAGAATGAATGAALGTAVFPGIGTGIGAGIGALGGILGGGDFFGDDVGDTEFFGVSTGGTSAGTLASAEGPLGRIGIPEGLEDISGERDASEFADKIVQAIQGVDQTIAEQLPSDMQNSVSQALKETPIESPEFGEEPELGTEGAIAEVLRRRVETALSELDIRVPEQLTAAAGETTDLAPDEIQQLTQETLNLTVGVTEQLDALNGGPLFEFKNQIEAIGQTQQDQLDTAKELGLNEQRLANIRDLADAQVQDLIGNSDLSRQQLQSLAEEFPQFSDVINEEIKSVGRTISQETQTLASARVQFSDLLGEPSFETMLQDIGAPLGGEISAILGPISDSIEDASVSQKQFINAQEELEKQKQQNNITDQQYIDTLTFLESKTRDVTAVTKEQAEQARVQFEGIFGAATPQEELGSLIAEEGLGGTAIAEELKAIPLEGIAAGSREAAKAGDKVVDAFRQAGEHGESFGSVLTFLDQQFQKNAESSQAFLGGLQSEFDIFATSMIEGSEAARELRLEAEGLGALKSELDALESADTLRVAKDAADAIFEAAPSDLSESQAQTLDDVIRSAFSDVVDDIKAENEQSQEAAEHQTTAAEEQIRAAEKQKEASDQIKEASERPLFDPERAFPTASQPSQEAQLNRLVEDVIAENQPSEGVTGIEEVGRLFGNTEFEAGLGVLGGSGSVSVEPIGFQDKPLGEDLQSQLPDLNLSEGQADLLGTLLSEESFSDIRGVGKEINKLLNEGVDATTTVVLDRESGRAFESFNEASKNLDIDKLDSIEFLPNVADSAEALDRLFLSPEDIKALEQGSPLLTEKTSSTGDVRRFRRPAISRERIERDPREEIVGQFTSIERTPEGLRSAGPRVSELEVGQVDPTRVKFESIELPANFAEEALGDRESLEGLFERFFKEFGIEDPDLSAADEVLSGLQEQVEAGSFLSGLFEDLQKFDFTTVEGFRKGTDLLIENEDKLAKLGIDVSGIIRTLGEDLGEVGEEAEKLSEEGLLNLQDQFDRLFDDLTISEQFQLEGLEPSEDLISTLQGLPDELELGSQAVDKYRDAILENIDSVEEGQVAFGILDERVKDVEESAKLTAESLAGLKTGFEGIFGEQDIQTQIQAQGLTGTALEPILARLPEELERGSDQAAKFGNAILFAAGKFDQISESDADAALQLVADRLVEIKEFGDQAAASLRGQFEQVFGEQGLSGQIEAAGLAGSELAGILNDLPPDLEAGSERLRGIGNEILDVADNSEDAQSALDILVGQLNAAEEAEQQLIDATQDLVAEQQNQLQAIQDELSSRQQDTESRLSSLRSERESLVGELESMAGAADDSADRIRGLQEDLRRFADELLVSEQLSPLPIQEQLAEARSQFQTTVGAARGGDEQALQNVQGRAQRVLELGQQTFARATPEFQNLFESVRGDIERAAGGGVGDSSPEQRQAQAAEAALEQLGALNRTEDRSVSEIVRQIEKLDRQIAQEEQQLTQLQNIDIGQDKSNELQDLTIGELESRGEELQKQIEQNEVVISQFDETKSAIDKVREAIDNISISVNTNVELPSNIESFAHGGISSGGPAFVGERGPEVVDFPSGARITPLDQIQSAAATSGQDSTQLRQAVASLIDGQQQQTQLLRSMLTQIAEELGISRQRLNEILEEAREAREDDQDMKVS